MTSLRLAAPMLALGLIAGCTKSELYIPQELRTQPIDNKVALSGGFCAENAESINAYLKVMFIIDRSNSLNVTDPNNRRLTAVRDVVMRFVEDPQSYRLRAGVEFAIVSFYGDVLVHTRDSRGLPGFSRNGQQILANLTQLAQTGSNTGYDKALAQAFLLLDSDAARMQESAKAKSRYELVFISDGMPFPENCSGESNAPSAAVRAVERLVSLASLYKVPITFHTAFASDPRMFTPGNTADTCSREDPLAAQYDTSIGDQTRALLQAMATAGGGTFRQFENGDTISFADFELADGRRMYSLANFLVTNTNALPEKDHVLADSDGDGLSDDLELLIGTSPTLADTDGDGFGDGIEWRFRASGLDPRDPSDGRCSSIDRGDVDGDGLRDCEELFIGTSRRSVDTDHDGLPDRVELVLGSDPTSANAEADMFADADADGGSNFDEVRWHTDPTVDDVAFRSLVAYDYNQSELPVSASGQACYGFEVTNISLASTLAAPPYEEVAALRHRAGYNRLLLYFAEKPYDQPLGDPLYRLACVDTRFVAERDLKMPAGGHFTVPMRRPSDTYRVAPVLRPKSVPCQASVNQDCGLNTLWCRFETDGTCQCYRPPVAVGDDANGTPAGPCPACSDGIDNDGDGLTDFPADPGCFDSMDNDEGPAPQCSDGIDNDGDGRIDWPYDPGCSSAYDNNEADHPQPLPECADGKDNDGNGTTDFPADPGCFAAADPHERSSILNPEYACSDGLDNDGDGLIDWPADPGCSDPNDIDEAGPAVCFYCQKASENLPGQCDLSASYCKARSGNAVAGGACTTRADCRGAPCISGRCAPCLRDRDCDTTAGAGDGLCDAGKGWCIEARATPKPCTKDADCAAPGGPGAGCNVPLGFCNIDRRDACRDERDCRPGQLCSEKLGFCLNKVFATAQCDRDEPCATGDCDLDLGWCLPTEDAQRCRTDDECPLGHCLDSGACDQQTFVFPDKFRPEADCLRAR
jgi:hypothetical protein